MHKPALIGFHISHQYLLNLWFTLPANYNIHVGWAIYFLTMPTTTVTPTAKMFLELSSMACLNFSKHPGILGPSLSLVHFSTSSWPSQQESGTYLSATGSFPYGPLFTQSEKFPTPQHLYCKVQSNENTC